MRRLLLLLASLASGTAVAAELARADASCDQVAEPSRWTAAGTPDIGRRPPLVSAHRGGVNLAPENTMWAYRHAFAYGMDFVEVDVRESLDGVLYSMHDDTVDRTTDGSGQVALMTSFQLDRLNAADFEPWIGSEYDPSPVPRLEEILQLAADSGGGIEFDIKFVKNYPLFFQMVERYGLMERSYFNMSGEIVTLVQLLWPEVRVIYNLAGDETAQTLYDETGRSIVYGSRLDKFTPENIAAIHDGCSLVLPHTYDEGPENEAAQFALALVRGADGAQSDQPDVIRAVLADPLAVKLEPSTDEGVGEHAVCLRNAGNGLGLPYKPLTVARRDRSAVPGGTTSRHGCINLPGAVADYVVQFAGDATAKAAQYNQFTTPEPPVTPPPAGDAPGAGRLGGGSLGAALLAGFWVLAWRRRKEWAR